MNRGKLHKAESALVMQAALIAFEIVALPAAANRQTVAADIADASAASAENGEIVVTALRRNASVQDTAAAIAVVSGELVSKMNVTSSLDLPSITPGVIIQSGPGSLPVAAMRGIGTNGSNQSFDHSVALFVDGIFIARGRDYVASLFDVGDIQVIKGSQSAVLGRTRLLARSRSICVSRPSIRLRDLVQP